MSLYSLHVHLEKYMSKLCEFSLICSKMFQLFDEVIVPTMLCNNSAENSKLDVSVSNFCRKV